jgi:hypothetical protein
MNFGGHFQNIVAATTKYLRMGGLKIIEIYYFTVLETRRPRSRCQKGWLLLRAMRRICTIPLFSLFHFVGAMV